MLLIFLIGTDEIMLEEHGFRSLQHCEYRAQAYMKNLDQDKYKYACMYDGDRDSSRLQYPLYPIEKL